MSNRDNNLDSWLYCEGVYAGNGVADGINKPKHFVHPRRNRRATDKRMKGKATGGRKVIYILIAIAVILLLGSIWGGKKLYTSVIDRIVKEREAATIKGYQDEIDRLNRLIQDKDAALKQSEKRYSAIIKRIKDISAKAETIKPPATNTEIKERLRELGYEAK